MHNLQLKIHSPEHGQGCDFVLQWLFFGQGKSKLNGSYQLEVSKQQLLNLKIKQKIPIINNAWGHAERWAGCLLESFSERMTTHRGVCRQDFRTSQSLQSITSQETSSDKIYCHTLEAAPGLHFINSYGRVMAQKLLYIKLKHYVFLLPQHTHWKDESKCLWKVGSVPGSIPRPYTSLKQFLVSSPLWRLKVSGELV